MRYARRPLIGVAIAVGLTPTCGQVFDGSFERPASLRRVAQSTVGRVTEATTSNPGATSAAADEVVVVTSLTRKAGSLRLASTPVRSPTAMRKEK